MPDRRTAIKEAEPVEEENGVGDLFGKNRMTSCLSSVQQPHSDGQT